MTLQKLRLTQATLMVLNSLLDRPADRLSGADISRAAGLLPGTLYPILKRLEDGGWVVSEWEDIDPKTEGRPRRRFYHLTAEGAKEAVRSFKSKPRPMWSWAYTTSGDSEWQT